MMFESVKIPKKLTLSPIKEANFEIRYNGNYPGEALYGILLDVFQQFPNKDTSELPIMQIPKQIRDNDPNFRYQPLYRVADNKTAFSIGHHSIVFSSLTPYCGWDRWSEFFTSLMKKLQIKQIIKSVERISLRYINLFDVNIFEHINAELILAGNLIKTTPSSFYTAFDQDAIHTIVTVGNAVTIQGDKTQKSLIDVDCIRQFDCEAESFFSTYLDALEKIHKVNKWVFFGLIKDDLLTTFKPEY